ncbi:MAG: hypothetical protein ACI9SC_000635 [Gammaproteobacteria bacterium]|jgi:hypothetical protein
MAAYGGTADLKNKQNHPVGMAAMCQKRTLTPPAGVENQSEAAVFWFLWLALLKTLLWETTEILSLQTWL